MSRLDDINLKGTVIKIMRTDKALNKVNFQVGQFTIGTMHYQILAGYMDIDRCHCSVDPATIPQGAAALYDPKSNTIIAKDSRLQYQDDKNTLVHEATHAIVDLMGGFNKSMSVTHLETETCAFLAAAMYSLAVTQTTASPGYTTTVYSKDQDIIAEANKLVRSKGLGPGATNAANPISFSSKDIGRLQSAIKANPLYKNDYKSVTLTDGM